MGIDTGSKGEGDLKEREGRMRISFNCTLQSHPLLYLVIIALVRLGLVRLGLVRLGLVRLGLVRIRIG